MEVAAVPVPGFAVTSRIFVNHFRRKKLGTLILMFLMILVVGNKLTLTLTPEILGGNLRNGHKPREYPTESTWEIGGKGEE